MTHSLVLDLAKSLKPEEVVEFRAFLRSPFFHRNTNVSELELLFDAIQSALEKGTPNALEKGTIYEQVFPGKQLIRNKLEKLSSELNKMFRHYLLTRRYFSAEQEPIQQLDWVKELRYRGLTARYQHAIDKVKKEQCGTGIESLEKHNYEFLLAQEEHEWFCTYNPKGDLNVPELVSRFDSYYIVYRTELLNRLYVQHKHTNLEPNALELLQNEWDVPESELAKSPLLQITWSIYKLLKAEEPPVNELKVLLETLQAKEPMLISDEIKAFYTYLRNLCTLYINLGHADFFAILHDIQKDNLRRGYFYFDGKILPNACLSITQTAIKIGAHEWARVFLEDHKDKIFEDGESREYYRLNLAMVLFAEKKYSEALDVLFFDTTFSIYHLVARRLELKIYYEMESELLPYKIDAFSMFVRRTGQKAFSNDTFEINNNFANLLRQLSLSSGLQDDIRSKRLIQRINSKKKIGERLWLLEKAAELGRNNKKTPR